MTFTFSPTDPGGGSDASYGSNLLGGSYRERLGGLHRNDIVVEGLFLLSRISASPDLNQ